MYKAFLRRFLFLFPPETAHSLAFTLLRGFSFVPGGKALLKALFCYHHPALEKTVFGLKFPNPIGLAAGFDKNALFLDLLPLLGFGFAEIGTVTPRPQSGNPKPRLFRLKKDRALLNRMGFNNDGVEVIAERLKNRNPGFVVGANIGKNKDTPNENALSDYLICFEKLFPFVDYFVVNVSSPNTPGLRSLQEKEPLKKILAALQNQNLLNKIPKPILLKIAPDLEKEQMEAILEIVTGTGIAGLVCTNTTLERRNLKTKGIENFGQGGISGKPLLSSSSSILEYYTSKSGGRFSLIGVGGIFKEADALEKLSLGADLIQVYTGWIYEGPGQIRRLLKAMAGVTKGFQK